MNNSMERVLFVVTSSSEIGPNKRKTGYEFSEVAHPYLAFAADGVQVDFASPNGGTPPEDGYDPRDMASQVFRESSGFERLARSHRLRDVEIDAYDGIFFPGGLGPMVDLAEDARAKRLIAAAYEEGKIIGAVCHGPVVLLGVELSDGSRLVAGRRVTSFTEAEELGHSDKDVPFFLDAALMGEGAVHLPAPAFSANVVVDGSLVTGQNPASAAGVARAMIAAASDRCG